MATNFTGKFFRGALGGPRTLVQKGPNNYFGRTAVTSITGGVQVNVACPVVGASSVILATPQFTGLNSAHPPVQFGVLGISAGSFFTYGNVGSYSHTGSVTVTCVWECVNPR